MLLEERPFDLAAPGWIFEIKFDGYRLMALVDRGQLILCAQGAATLRQRTCRACKLPKKAPISLAPHLP